MIKSNQWFFKKVSMNKSNAIFLIKNVELFHQAIIVIHSSPFFRGWNCLEIFVPVTDAEYMTPGKCDVQCFLFFTILFVSHAFYRNMVLFYKNIVYKKLQLDW